MARRQSRSIKDLRRKKSYKNARDIILIVCEGKATEPNYFKSLRSQLRLSTIEVEIRGEECGSAPINVIDYALELRHAAARDKTRLPFDTVWCILDVEQPEKHKSIDDAYIKGRDNGLTVVLSNPCFEFWYLLHFVKSCAGFNKNSDVIRSLKQYIKNYTKNQKTTFSIVYPLTKSAINNSIAVISEKQWGLKLINCNPSTHMHIIVDYLLRVAQN
jgi:hypothetical protein